MSDSSACRNCRRPIYYYLATGWLHGELAQYAHEDITCENAHPIECGNHRCKDRDCHGVKEDK